MAKTRKEFRLNYTTIETLNKIKESYGLPSTTAALEKVVENFSSTDDFAKRIAKEVALLLNKPLTRIRLGTNNADRNSEVTLLLLNSLLSYSGYKSFVTEETPQLIAAKNKVADKINVFRKKKLEREKTKKEKPTLLQDIEIEEINWGDVDGDS